ncbi:STAS domain-containing protein [Mycobacterium sp. NPDC051804]|uniref:STAS domain-containing protein n=1 Tax=Mycobacterium sp. NPDC051804 TaxID=3364295 RepID=UPI00378F8130
MATPVSVRTGARDDGTAVLSVTGELDVSNIDVFSTAIADAMTPASQDGGVLTIDLTGVEYLDSAAIDVLFGHADRVRLIVNPILLPVLKISGLTNVMSVEAG